MSPTCQCCEVHQESGRERVHTVNGRLADLTACKGKYVSEDHSALKTMINCKRRKRRAKGVEERREKREDRREKREERKEEKEEWGGEREQAKKWRDGSKIR